MFFKQDYPYTKKGTISDCYFGKNISDPYRWLEDDFAEDTIHWVEAQNKFTFDYLAKVKYREKIKNRLEKLWNYPKMGRPFKQGEYFYYFKNDGLQNQHII